MQAPGAQLLEAEPIRARIWNGLMRGKRSLLPGNFFLMGELLIASPHPVIHVTHSWQSQTVRGAQDSCHSSAAGAVGGSEPRPRTRHGVDGRDGQQPGHGDVEVPVQGLLDEEGPSVHVDLEKKDRYHR